MALPYKSWENTPLDPRPPPKGSPAERLPPPVTRPFSRVFSDAVVRHARLAEFALFGVVVSSLCAWWFARPADEDDTRLRRDGQLRRGPRGPHMPSHP